MRAFVPSKTFTKCIRNVGDATYIYNMQSPRSTIQLLVRYVTDINKLYLFINVL